jgi:hypothetical protein
MELILLAIGLLVFGEELEDDDDDDEDYFKE